jgi:hypothetical protein
MTKKGGEGIDIVIDKLTRSIENVLTGESFPTDVSLISLSDLPKISKKNGWKFDWKREFDMQARDIFKLTTTHNPTVLQGLLSLEVKEDHVFVHLVENAPFNVGSKKMYAGVAGNLMAFACKVSFQRGHEGNIAFISKTRLIDHYVKTLGAYHFKDRLMIIESKAAIKLIHKYFHND